jgi:hypothetical protein
MTHIDTDTDELTTDQFMVTDNIGIDELITDQFMSAGKRDTGELTTGQFTDTDTVLIESTNRSIQPTWSVDRRTYYRSVC